MYHIIYYYILYILYILYIYIYQSINNCNSLIVLNLKIELNIILNRINRTTMNLLLKVSPFYILLYWKQ